MQIITIQGGAATTRQMVIHWQHQGKEESMSPRKSGRLWPEAGLGLWLRHQERNLSGIQERGEVFLTEPKERYTNSKIFLNV